MTPRATGDHDYRDGDHCRYCGTKISWPLAKQPCPRAKMAINAIAAKERAMEHKARIRAAEKQASK